MRPQRGLKPGDENKIVGKVIHINLKKEIFFLVNISLRIMVRIGAVIFCRMSSKRLPGKILKNISNKTLLKRIVERVRLIKKIDNIIIATSKNKNDDPIVQYAKKEGVDFYRGNLSNVLRSINAAESFNLNYILNLWR